MPLNRFFFVLLLLISISCNDIFNKQNTNVSNLKTIEQPIEQPINYSSLDAYPLLPECENITNRILQKDCFYKKITTRIQKTLNTNFIEIATNIQDTIWVKINVNSLGKTTIKTIVTTNKIKEYLPKLDSILSISIEKLPILKPAIKLGIPVTSEFSLPILIRNN